MLLCASASSQDAEDTLVKLSKKHNIFLQIKSFFFRFVQHDIKWLMSLQANQYLVYLGRDDENQVTRDDDHRPPRPPPSSLHYSSSIHRTDHLNLPQHVPNPTPIAQSTPRSVTQIPTATTLQSMDTHRSRQSQYHTMTNTPNRSFTYLTSLFSIEMRQYLHSHF